MSESGENRVCRACLCQITDDDTCTELRQHSVLNNLNEVIQFCVPDFNINVKNPCLCPLCFSTFYMFYEYKKRCSYTGDIIRSYFEVNQQQDVLDLNDVLAYQNDVGLINACWRCRLCDEEVYFFTREELADHLVETHGRNRETTCLRCNFQLPSRTDLKRHRCFVINGDTVVCFVCNKEFSDMSKLKIHVEIQHEFACFPCMKVLKSRRAYRKHNRMFHKRDLLEYKCSICEKYFTKMASLKLHLRVAHKKKVKVASKCPYCRKPCLRGYRKHVASHEKPGVRKYTCTICKFVYFSPSAFLTHLRGYHELEINGF